MRDSRLQREVRGRMRQLGLSAVQLSRRAGLGDSFVSELLRGRARNPQRASLLKLAGALGCPPSALLETDPAGEAAPDALAAGGGELRPAGAAAAWSGERDLPVYAAAEGGEGAMIIGTEPVEWLRRPAPLAGVQDAFAFYVVGESMVPAYEQGDMVLIHPGRPPRREDDAVFIRPHEGGGMDALLKRLDGWSDSDWQVRQWNPARRFALPRALWQQAWQVVGKYHRR